MPRPPHIARIAHQQHANYLKWREIGLARKAWLHNTPKIVQTKKELKEGRAIVKQLASTLSPEEKREVKKERDYLRARTPWVKATVRKAAHKYKRTPKGRATQRKYFQNQKGKEAAARYKKSTKGKDASAKYFRTEKGKAARSRFFSTAKGKEAMRRRNSRKRLKEILEAKSRPNLTRIRYILGSVLSEQEAQRVAFMAQMFDGPHLLKLFQAIADSQILIRWRFTPEDKALITGKLERIARKDIALSEALYSLSSIVRSKQTA